MLQKINRNTKYRVTTFPIATICTYRMQTAQHMSLRLKSYKQEMQEPSKSEMGKKKINFLLWIERTVKFYIEIEMALTNLTSSQ